jgi:hypothetical protein
MFNQASVGCNSGDLAKRVVDDDQLAIASAAQAGAFEAVEHRRAVDRRVAAPALAAADHVDVLVLAGTRLEAAGE